MSAPTEAQIDAALDAWYDVYDGVSHNGIPAMRAALIAAEAARPVPPPLVAQILSQSAELDSLRQRIERAEADYMALMRVAASKDREREDAEAERDEAQRICGGLHEDLIRCGDEMRTMKAERDAARAQAEALAGALTDLLKELKFPLDNGDLPDIRGSVIAKVRETLAAYQSERVNPADGAARPASGGADARPASAPSAFSVPPASALPYSHWHDARRDPFEPDAPASAPDPDAREHGAPWGAMPPQDALRERAHRVALGFLRDPEDIFITDHIQLNTLTDEIAAALTETAEEARCRAEEAMREKAAQIANKFWLDYPMAHVGDAEALEDFCDAIAAAIRARGER